MYLRNWTRILNGCFGWSSQTGAKSITIFKKLNTNLRQTDFIVKEMDKKSDNKVHLK